MGSFQTIELIETFINYQESIKQCVCIVYDPQHSALSGMAIKAVKLKDSFIEVYKQGVANLTTEKLKGANIAWQDVFEDIPVQIHNSALATALMLQIEPDTLAGQVRTCSTPYACRIVVLC
jgi:translation initiation factor 3 subunit H